jgi:hypothetical protein
MPRTPTGKVYKYHSSSLKPTNATENSLLTELDTEDRYRYNEYGRWEFIPPIGLKSKRLHGLFIPNTFAGTMIFGAPVIQNINSELHSSGCMIYQLRTSTSASEDSTSFGGAGVDDFAQPELLPKMEAVFSFNDTGANSATFIGLKKDADPVLETTTAYWPSALPVIGMGYKTSDTNLFLLHNDASGAVNRIDMGVARSDNVFWLEIEFHTTTSVRLSLFDINRDLLYENTLTTEIPPAGTELGFLAIVQNANTAQRYVINLFDYVRLEKNKAPLNKTTDF